MHTLYTRINTGLLVFIALTGIVLVTMMATRAYGGPLDPPGPVASTQSSVIYQPAGCANFPIVLSAPGPYMLGGNITGCAGKDGIQITASSVILDLGGFSVIGVPGSADGIKNVGGNGQLNVANGAIVAWGSHGLNLDGSSTDRVDNITAKANGGHGIVLPGTSSLHHSASTANGGSGIFVPPAATNVLINNCMADYNGGAGIDAQGPGVVVDGCEVGSNTSTGISVGNNARVVNNHVHHNAVGGILAADSCYIGENSVTANAGGGVRVLAPGNCMIVDNQSAANTSHGFRITEGGRSLISGNHAAGNSGFGFRIDPATPGQPNVIIGNVATNNGLSNFSIDAGNDGAPVVTAGAATNPLSNISN